MRNVLKTTAALSVAAAMTAAMAAPAFADDMQPTFGATGAQQANVYATGATADTVKVSIKDKLVPELAKKMGKTLSSTQKEFVKQAFAKNDSGVTEINKADALAIVNGMYDTTSSGLAAVFANAEDLKGTTEAARNEEKAAIQTKLRQSVEAIFSAAATEANQAGGNGGSGNSGDNSGSNDGSGSGSGTVNGNKKTGGSGSGSSGAKAGAKDGADGQGGAAADGQGGSGSGSSGAAADGGSGAGGTNAYGTATTNGGAAAGNTANTTASTSNTASAKSSTLAHTGDMVPAIVAGVMAIAGAAAAVLVWRRRRS